MGANQCTKRKAARENHIESTQALTDNPRLQFYDPFSRSGKISGKPG
jgi:hypothetical protein